MEHGATVLRDLFVMFVAAKLLAEVFERISQPVVIAEILAGVLIGPFVIGLVRPGEVHATFAELGVIFLLFSVGLEINVADIFRVGATAALVAVTGVILPFIAGYALMSALGYNSIESVFIGAALVATSVGITARVLSELGKIDSVVARVILGAAVIDDILGMLVLAVVSSMSSGSIDYIHIAIVGFEAIAFTAIIVFFGRKVVHRLSPSVANLQTAESYFFGAIALCLGLSVLAAQIGIAAIIGAFLAGMALSEKNKEYDLDSKIHPIFEFLTPFFFVSMGMQLDLRVFADTSVLGVAALVSIVAIATKFAGCGLASHKLGFRPALAVGVGMIPRGEVGIIVALACLQLGSISNALYAVVLIMSMVTTLIAPPLLKPLLLDKTQTNRTA